MRNKIVYILFFIIFYILLLPNNIYAKVDENVTIEKVSNTVDQLPYKSIEIQSLIKMKNEIQKNKNVEPLKNGFDVIIFMGQSNMVGYGTGTANTLKINVSDKNQVLNNYNKSSYEKIKCIKDGNSYSGYEVKYQSNGKVAGLSKISEPFGHSKDSNTTGSMVTAFVNAYYLNTGVPVLAIPAAKGGSSIYKDWQDGQFYLEQAKLRLTALRNWASGDNKDNKVYKIRHIYMVWQQGESDDITNNNISYNISYENALHNTVMQMQDVGVERAFMISIGHLYVPRGFESKYINTAKRHIRMINEQYRICQENDWITLVSNSFEKLSRCHGIFMIDQVHFNQNALNIVGSEAGRNVAKYADQARGTTLSKTQSDALRNFAKEFTEDGYETKKLVYGIIGKNLSYNLVPAEYKSMFIIQNGKSYRTVYFLGKDKKGYFLNRNGKIGYNWDGSTNMKDFEVGNRYIGMDCSTYASFLYHYVFGLGFNTVSNDGKTIPWTTADFIANKQTKTYDTNENIDTFKVVYEQHALSAKFTLKDLQSLAMLQPGDILIGRKGENNGVVDENKNHVVIYVGDGKITHATSIPHVYKMKAEDGGYYYIGESSLENTAKYESQCYRDVYVLRLNDNIIPGGNYVYNNKNVDWSNLPEKTFYDLKAPEWEVIKVERQNNSNIKIVIKSNEAINYVENITSTKKMTYNVSGNGKIITINCSKDAPKVVLRDKNGNGSLIEIGKTI